jgi:hypothetical protein
MNSFAGGFVDEKIEVPSSVLHDIESSLATHLKDRITTHHHRVGQVRLRRPDEIKDRQMALAFDRFRGCAAEELFEPKVAFQDDPDQRVQRFGITVDAHLEMRNCRGSRHATAQELEALRQRCLKRQVTYNQQLKIEQDTQRKEFIDAYCQFRGPVSEEKRDELTAFTESTNFAAVPLFRIEAHLFCLNPHPQA